MDELVREQPVARAMPPPPFGAPSTTSLPLANASAPAARAALDAPGPS
jgi:hypothetical protein